MPRPDPFLRPRLLIGTGLILATLVVYSQVGQFDFVRVDDPSYVVKNPHVRTGLSRENVAWAFTSFEESNWHPLTWISLMVDAEVGGTSPRPYHWTNVLLHIANTLVLFHVLVRMTRATWRSAFVACLFAVHPLHVESVAWVVERKDVLSTLFWFLALWAYVRYAERPTVRRHVLVLAPFALGLMSKPMLVTLPLLLLVLDFWPLGRLRGKSSFRSLCLEKTPMLGLSLASSVLTLYAQSGAMGTFDVLPLKVRLANAVVSYTTYATKMLWPVGLAIHQPYESNLPMLRVTVSALILAAVTALAIGLRARRPYLLAGWLWYLITLVPVIGLVQVGLQSMADRYTYVPLIGLFIVIAWGAPDLFLGESPTSPRRRVLLATAAVLVLAVLAGRARVEAGHWRDSTELLTHAVEVNDRNLLAHLGLAQEHTDRGRLEEAVSHYQKAVRLSPENLTARVNLGAVLIRLGRHEEAAAQFAEAIPLNPKDAELHANLGIAQTRLGRLDEAEESLTEALRLDPDSATAHRAIAVVLGRRGRNEEALDHLRRALPASPEDAGLHVNLATILMRLGQGDEAAVHFAEALRLRPNDATTQRNFGLLRLRQGKTKEAVDRLSEAARLDPQNESLRKELQQARELLEGEAGVR